MKRMALVSGIVRVAKADMPLLALLAERGSLPIDRSKVSVQRRGDRFVQKGWALLSDGTLRCTPEGFRAAQSAKVQGLLKKQA
ncbi:hypothetical protein [Terricaulis sp.]|uniref:hypothetical protein n=1 Tax=Terricaulis sp. TaxID=2768686 RepID=UPI00378494DE